MLEKTKNQIKLIAIILIICLTAPNLLLCIPSNAETSEYSLTDATVTLDGETDATVEVDLVTATGGTFYALQAIWDLNDNETGSYFTLSDLEAAGSVSAMENDPATGYIVWTDASYTGFDVDAGGTIWTATYTIDKDTPSGTYTVDCYLISVTGGRNEYDSEDPFETLTATITVERTDDEEESGDEDEDEDVYTATFDADDGVASIDIYYTQDYETDSTVTADETDVTTAIARDGSTGAQDTSGSGQINFLINLEDNYLIDSITIEGGYKNLKDSTDTGIENMYRITKITSDLTITVVTKERESIVPEITGYDASYEYTGSSIEPTITVNIYGTTTTLTEGTDYTVSYGENTEVGTGTIYISSVATSDYVFEDTSVNFSIVEKELTEDDVTVPTSITYTGSALSPEVVVYANGTTLVENTDYTVTYTNNVDAGTATVTIEGIGNYSGTVTLTFTISQAEITPTVDNIDDVTYNATAQEPSVTVTYDGTTLIEDEDYTVTYTNNTNVGTATATISAISGGNYSFDDITTSFNITEYTLTDSDVSLEYTTVRYDGTEKEPEVTVTINGTTMSSSEYSVAYSNNTQIGTATVTITSTGSNFTGTVEKTFSIVDKDVLTISGISDNQSIVYTGSEVVLEGTLTVSDNDNEITADDLTVTWYDENGNEISQPTNVGSYSVLYSYSDTDYEGSLTINFEITKATSGTPSEVTEGLTAIEGQTLADVELTTDGLYWVDETTEVAAGNNTYYATYTQNDDTTNYTTETVLITVYGKVYIDITTSVNGSGGSISDSIEDVLEGTTETITFTPDDGYEIDNVTVNETETSVSDNTLTITAGTVDLEVIVTYTLSSTDETTDDEETDDDETNDTTTNSSSDDETDDNSTNSTDSTTSTSSLPETGDTILKFIVLFVISVAGIFVSIKKIRDIE